MPCLTTEQRTRLGAAATGAERGVMADIEWRNETRKLADLKPQEDNPRQITKPQAERLLKSWHKFNQVQTVAINPDGTILDGHQRYFVLLAAHEDSQMEVDVRVSSRELTRREWQELVVLLHEGAVGSWNWDALAEWDGVDVPDLVEWGFSEEALGILPSAGEWDEAFGGLPTDDRAPFQQMTFTLHDSQVEQIKVALSVSKSIGDFNGSPNQNSNGNALARICETFVTDYGQS